MEDWRPAAIGAFLVLIIAAKLIIARLITLNSVSDVALPAIAYIETGSELRVRVLLASMGVPAAESTSTNAAGCAARGQ